MIGGARGLGRPGRSKPMAETLLSRAAALLEHWGGSYPAKVNELASLLQSVRAEGRQEGFAAARERAARVASDHKGAAQRKRHARGQRLASLPDYAQAEVEAEERGEDIASEVIAREIRALKPASEEGESDG